MATRPDSSLFCLISPTISQVVSVGAVEKLNYGEKLESTRSDTFPLLRLLLIIRAVPSGTARHRSNIVAKNSVIPTGFVWLTDKPPTN